MNLMCDERRAAWTHTQRLQEEITSQEQRPDFQLTRSMTSPWNVGVRLPAGRTETLMSLSGSTGVNKKTNKAPAHECQRSTAPTVGLKKLKNWVKGDGGEAGELSGADRTGAILTNTNFITSQRRDSVSGMFGKTREELVSRHRLCSLDLTSNVQTGGRFRAVSHGNIMRCCGT